VLRLLCAAFVLCAIVLAPAGVRLAHSPAAMVAAADLHVHGHDHRHGPDHPIGQVQSGDPAGGHDASDHEQQVRLHPARASADPVPGGDGVAPSSDIATPDAIRDGPRRPPRLA
jgi:hypothetical protein